MRDSNPVENGSERPRGAIGNQATGVEEGNAGGELVGFLQVLGGEEDGGWPPAPAEPWSWSCLVFSGAGGGMSGVSVDGDVAIGGAGAHLHRVLARFRALGGVQAVVHVAELRIELQPGRDAVTDSDIELAEASLDEDRTTRDLAEADVAVGGLGRNRGVRLIDRDLPVCRVQPKVAGDLANPSVAVGVLDHGGAVDAADLHRTRTRSELSVVQRSIHGDVTRAGLERHRASLVELDIADAGLIAAFAEPTCAPQRRDPCIGPHVRPRRKRDLHIDRLAASPRGVPPPSLGCLDQQPAAGVLDASLIGAGHVRLLGTVARAHLNDGVSALSCHDPDVTDPELHGDGDGFGSIESRHGSPSGGMAGGPAAESRGARHSRARARLARPARVALSALRGAWLAPTVEIASFQSGGRCSYEPGVDRKSFAARGLLDPSLEVIMHAEVDPRHRALVSLDSSARRDTRRGHR